MKGGTSHADQREAWYQARKKFSDIKLELPEGVIGPIFNDEYGDVTGCFMPSRATASSQWELSDIAEDIKRRLLKVPMVKKVDIYGKQAKKVYVEFSQRAARRARHHAAADRRKPAEPEHAYWRAARSTRAPTA